MASIARRVLDPAETVYTITDLVADGALGELSSPQREGILAVRRASRGLTRLAQDLYTVATVERGDVPLSLAPVEIGNLVEQAAMLAIPIASERRQMVEISVEPGLVHPRMDEVLFSRVTQALALDVVEGSPDATKVILSAHRAPGGIEILIAGAEREDEGKNGDSRDEELTPVLARLLTVKHEGTFEIRTEEGVGYRIWLPVPPYPSSASPSAAPAAPSDPRPGPGSEPMETGSAPSQAA